MKKRIRTPKTLRQYVQEDCGGNVALASRQLVLDYQFVYRHYTGLSRQTKNNGRQLLALRGLVP